METTKIPLSQCVESSYQNRKELGDVSGLARSIEVNGQITPLIAVADGEAYQLVAGHRRTAAMKSLGLEEADAYVMDGWDDAREGFREPRGKALDPFILMRTIPACVPGLPERVLKRDYEPWSGDLEVLRIRLSARHR
ncbi:ParB/RepB/Spo0J family partition protein [Adlercreutzia muris]|uniref:ParB/RepB/Spo0J family partition protein n=1 Tax=Adlercreutzia muris TaxID=1796610 RepID=UPI0021D5FDCA|nr:ParB/RepB/Spo0J family partition protein [Adlercreutzia muris]MCU7585833.1 ParB/RepB/Spo0J family partition protein [Adlercreutzia muris]